MDKVKGYNFLKRTKLSLSAKIANVFDSNETSLVLILLENGDLFTLNLETDKFLRIASNPNSNSKSKTKTSEISHEGSMISVCMDNGDFFIYKLSREKSNMFTILTNPSKIKTSSQKDPLSHYFFKNTLRIGKGDSQKGRISGMGKSLLSAYQTEKTLLPLQRTDAQSVLDFKDNVSYKSFLPDQFEPVAILSSSEDPLLAHRNIVNIYKSSKSLSFLI